MTTALAWVFIGLFLWWLGRQEQLGRRRGEASRVRRPPAWLVALCGAPATADSLHLPMAVLQVTGIAIAALGPVVVLVIPPDTSEYARVARVVAVGFLVPYVVAESITLLRRLLGRR